MIGRRTQPLLVLCFLGAGFLILRLHELQVEKHALWAREAARLVHSGTEIPYRRGAVRDRNGIVLARDKGTYELGLVYRQFRRGHPLGLLAHGRSLIEERAVHLQEARDFLPQWTLDLVSLSPAELKRYAEGEGQLIEGIQGADRPIRARRAADLGYYIRRLLDLDSRDWKDLEKAVTKEEREHSYLALAARHAFSQELTEQELWNRIEKRLVESMSRLDRLAEELYGRELSPGPMSALDRLVQELEEARSWVEDASASKLFEEAAGFPPGRLLPETLLDNFDLSWIQRILAWDSHRLEAWAETGRRAWLSNWRDGYALPRIMAELRLDPAFHPGPDDVLDRLASIFGAEGSVESALDGRAPQWRSLDRLAVYADVMGNLRVPLVPPPVALGFQDPELRAADPVEPWSLVDRACDRPGVGRSLAAYLRGKRWSDAESASKLATEIVDHWESRFQQGLAAALENSRAAARDKDLSPGGRLAFAEGSLDRALERADYYLKDYGTRSRRLQRGEPDYAVVYLLTRYEESYPGFVARHSRSRVYLTLEGDPGPLASELIGTVSSPDVYDLQRQRLTARRFRELRNLPDRSDDEERELTRLVGMVVLHDEKQGVEGVEGFWDNELAGTNGYREDWGLQDAVESDFEGPVREVVDGEDVFLTLDVRLQRAAERTLRDPEPALEDPDYDTIWQQNPVGAICLVSVNGEVLAAASEPNARSELGEFAAGQRQELIERTLRQPTFQPPGSVFKPFVAAHALQSAGLDPEWEVNCAEIERGGAGYVDVRCHRARGHGPVDLHDALVGSCNAYFAALGERLGDQDFRRLIELFGFGRPTGVRTAPSWSPETVRRIGLLEDVPRIFAHRLGDFERRLAGNGLGVVDTTPMQMARATLALATGRLADLRLVRKVGDRPIEPGAAPEVELREDVFERIHKAMEAVTSDPQGTAYAALRPELLGFRMSAKTGSADFTSRSRTDDRPGGRVRKHTWVTGWLPPEDPVAAFVIFMHDTSSTSSHGAVYLARQFFQQPEVRSWLGTQGVRLENGPTNGESGQ